MMFDRSTALATAKARHKKRLSTVNRHYTSVRDLSPVELTTLITRTREMKSRPRDYERVLDRKLIAQLYQKTSTRTRCSFDIAVHELGGHCTYIDWKTSNFVLADLKDEIVVLSRYYDAIIARVHSQSVFTIMKNHSESSIINGLSNTEHPCQALADMFTIVEYYGEDVTGLNLTYVGDCNNVARSLAYAAEMMGINMTISCPKNYVFADRSEFDAAGIRFVSDPIEAAKDAHVLYTDTWVSIGDEEEAEVRIKAFEGYCLDRKLYQATGDKPLIMHCLPAHPGYEITEDLLRSDVSIVFDQAENRIHAQKAILSFLLDN